PTASLYLSAHSAPLLLYQRAPPPPALHSFPTRRSSDLEPGAAGAAPSRRRPGRGEGACGLGGQQLLSLGSGPVSLGRRRGRHAQDRKSTRLNSSHVSISYAVFCLKKQNLGDERSGPSTD